MNREVENSELQMTAEGIPFEIATTGNSGSLVRNESKLSAVRSEYKDGIVSGTYRVSNNGDSLKLRYDPNVDDPLTEDIDESEDPDIGPDSTGSFSFYIIPKSSGTIDVDILIDIISFKAVKDQSNNERLVEVNSSLTTASGLTAEQITNCQEGAEYLKGHLMFFTGLSNTPSSYSYTNPKPDKTIHFHKDNVVTDTPYPVNIYWTWPNTLGQIALKTNANNLLYGIPVVEQTPNMGTTENPTDKAIVLEYLKDNKDIVFKDVDYQSGLTTSQKAEYQTLTTDAQRKAYLDNKLDNWIENADNETYFDLLSDGYNTADFSVGSSIDYFLIELTVTNGT